MFTVVIKISTLLFDLIIFELRFMTIRDRNNLIYRYNNYVVIELITINIYIKMFKRYLYKAFKTVFFVV